MRAIRAPRAPRRVTNTWGPRNRTSPRTSSAKPIAQLRERRAVEAKAAAVASGQTGDGLRAGPLCKSHRIDRRQRMRDAGPAVALVLAHPQPAGGRTECKLLAAAVERQRVAIDDVVGVRLGQPAGQHVEALAAVARARHRKLAATRDALLVFDLRHEPRHIGIARMDRDCKAEG